jgi:hypothetical protein
MCIPCVLYVCLASIVTNMNISGISGIYFFLQTQKNQFCHFPFVPPARWWLVIKRQHDANVSFFGHRRIVMQAGFGMYEAGSVQEKNHRSILFKARTTHSPPLFLSLYNAHQRVHISVLIMMAPVVSDRSVLLLLLLLLLWLICRTCWILASPVLRSSFLDTASRSVQLIRSLVLAWSLDSIHPFQSLLRSPHEDMDICFTWYV